MSGSVPWITLVLRSSAASLSRLASAALMVPAMLRDDRELCGAMCGGRRRRGAVRIHRAAAAGWGGWGGS